MQKAIKMTSKGTFTLPAKVRQELGLKKAGDKLMLYYHPKSQTVEIRKAPDLRALQDEIARLVPENPAPLDLSEVRRHKHKALYEDHLA